MNFEQARQNMVEQQIRPWHVLDRDVLDLMAHLPREDFVPDRYRKLAFSDTRIPIDHGQVMMSPKVEARALQSLAVQPGDIALEIGTGSGYFTALLANLAQAVHSVDIFDDFIEVATTRLGKHGFNNVRLQCQDVMSGWRAQANYDVIAVTGAVTVLPDFFRQILNPGGRLFVVAGSSPAMDARVITRVGDSDWSVQSLFETDLPVLIGAEPQPQFNL